jgi:hypothetical protein
MWSGALTSVAPDPTSMIGVQGTTPSTVVFRASGFSG